MNQKPPTSILSVTERAEALMVRARELWQAGDLPKASEAMVEACALSRESGDLRLQAEAYMRIGIIYNWASKNDLAFRAVDQALAFAREGKITNSLIDKIQANRSAFLLGAGFLRKSLDALTDVIERTRDYSDADGLASHINSQINLIYNFYLLGKLKAALDVGAKISEVARDANSPIAAINRVHYFCWHAMTLAHAGDTKRAIELLGEARTMIPAGNKLMEINFSIALAVSEVHAGLVDNGISRLVETVRHAENAGISYENALHALLLVYEHVGNIAKALETIEKLENVMKASARGVVGIEGDEDASETPEDRVFKAEEIKKSIAAVKKAEADGKVVPGLVEEIEESVDTTWVRSLDDRAARLRMRRFNELTHAERGELFDQLAKAAALVDDETGKHCARVELLTYKFGLAMGWDEAKAKLVSQAARLHDVGKLGIPHRILLAPRKLTSMEYEIVKKHVNIGVDLLGFSQAEVVKMARIIAQGHHEKWDGSGYPKKLFEDLNPIEARMVSIVDVFDVMTHSRAYKRAWNVQFAREELAYHAGGQFDPNLVEIFLRDVVLEDYVIPTDFPNEIPTMFETSELGFSN